MEGRVMRGWWGGGVGGMSLDPSIYRFFTLAIRARNTLWAIRISLCCVSLAIRVTSIELNHLPCNAHATELRGRQGD